jgi:hypothetical protein
MNKPLAIVSSWTDVIFRQTAGNSKVGSYHDNCTRFACSCPYVVLRASATTNTIGMTRDAVHMFVCILGLWALHHTKRPIFEVATAFALIGTLSQ